MISTSWHFTNKQTWVLGKLQIFHYHYCNKWPRPKVWRGQDHTSRGVNSKNRTRRGGKSTSRARNKYVHSWSICLLLESDVNNSSANHHLFLFTYANKLLITCGFPFNIHDLFVYFFKVMSTKAAQVTTCFYLLMEIGYWLHVVFFLILSIFCLLVHSEVNKSSASHHLFLFTYANRLFITCAFLFNIEYLFVYLFKAMSTTADGSDHLFLFTSANSFFLDLVFVIIFMIYLLIYLKRCQQKQVESTICFYLVMKMTCCETWLSF